LFLTISYSTTVLGLIRSCVLNAPGSWHDSKVARPIYDKLVYDTPDGFYIIADSAFPHAPSNVELKIRRSLKSGERLPNNTSEQADFVNFNRALLSYRQTAEWGMRALQGAYGRLRVPLDANNSEIRLRILESCVRLHNLRTTRIGINQICTVYMPEWETTEDDRFWDDVEDMMQIKDVLKHDRVSRFHLLVVDEDV
jgi:hypothetical protein